MGTNERVMFSLRYIKLPLPDVPRIERTQCEPVQEPRSPDDQRPDETQTPTPKTEHGEHQENQEDPPIPPRRRQIVQRRFHEFANGNHRLGRCPPDRTLAMAEHGFGADPPAASAVGPMPAAHPTARSSRCNHIREGSRTPPTLSSGRAVMQMCSLITARLIGNK